MQGGLRELDEACVQRKPVSVAMAILLHTAANAAAGGRERAAIWTLPLIHTRLHLDRFAFFPSY